MSSNYFDECIDGRFILKTTEPQDISVYLNDGSHYIPSGLNRQNGLGAIVDADTMLPFAYDDKSANGIFLTDDMVQVREPTMCFERSPFGRVEPPYPMETNMDVLNTLNTYPDGTLVNPSAQTVRQQDGQIIQTPASQAITFQNAYITDRMNEFQEKGMLQKIYEIMVRREQQSEQRDIVPHGTLPAPQGPPDNAPPAPEIPSAPPAPPLPTGTEFPEHIYETETSPHPDMDDEEFEEEKQMEVDEDADARENLVTILRGVQTVGELREIAEKLGQPTTDDDGRLYTKAVLRERLITFVRRGPMSRLIEFAQS